MKTLSASKIGHPCDMNLWFASNDIKEEFSPHTKRIFAVGSALESVVVSFLMEDGFDVFYNEKDHNSPTDFVINVAGGAILGRYDILFRRPKEKLWVVGDIKTMNKQAFSWWKRKGTAEKYPQYLKQLTVYYKGLSLSRDDLSDKIAIIGFCKDDSSYLIETMNYDEKVWFEIKERAERIFAQKNMFEPKRPSWACSYCGYKKICPFVSLKKTTNAEKIDGEDYELAAYMLSEARKMYAEARTLEKEAKELLDSLPKEKDLLVGSYIVRIDVNRQHRLDAKKLKEKKPDVYQEFLTVSEIKKIKIEEVCNE